MLSTIFKKVLSLFWESDPPVETDEEHFGLTPEEAEKIFIGTNPSDDDDELETEGPNECNECTHKTGTITAAYDNTYTIDGDVQFASNEHFEVGTKVTFLLFDSGNQKSVANVNPVETARRGGKKQKLCLRTLVCKVIKRRQRVIVVHPGDTEVDLNKVATEFIPITGDWIELDVKCELIDDLGGLYGDILEITRLRPLRVQVVVGHVKQWNCNSMTGNINNYIYFNVDSLINGYLPMIGDEVTTECIESDQEDYKWRSLKVLLNKSKIRKQTPNNSPLHRNVEHKKNVEGLVITDNIIVDFEKFSDRRNITVRITNNNSNEAVLLDAKFEVPYIQCRILTDCNNVKIEPYKSFLVEIECRPKYVGVSKELLLLNFSDFKIGRWIELYLEPLPSSFVKKKYTNTRVLMERARNMHNAPQFDKYVGGELNHRPHFIGVSLKSYEVPKELYSLVLQYDNIQKDSEELAQKISERYKFISSPVNYLKYQEYFQLLLYLDEIYEMISIRMYDCDDVYFIKNGEYLMLEVENLGERRPSLIVGDKVTAVRSDDQKKMAYEGFIHKISANHIYVKFASDMHHNYNDEKYCVTMSSSRTLNRRKHQAVQLASRFLGEHMLFPTKVIIKPPQVIFDAPETKSNGDGDNTKSPLIPQVVDNDNSGTKMNTRKALIMMKMQEHAQHYQNNPKRNEKTDIGAFEYTTKLHQVYPSQIPQIEWFNDSLNYYQKEAVKNILLGVARPLPYVIFGPPGTGKTVTVIETALQILRLIPHARLLLCAPSNSAANLLVVRMIESGVIKPGDLVRCVSYKCLSDNNIPPLILPYSATIQLAREGTSLEETSFTKDGLTLGMDSTTIGKHKVTVTTCCLAGTLYNTGITSKNFTHIIIDEAGQTTEPELMMALSFLDTKNSQAILAGDPKQLGPVVLSNLAKDFGLGESYLERILNRFPYTRDMESFPKTGGYDPRLVTRLVYNYRSLPEILNLPNKLFYENTLVSTISPNDSKEAVFLKHLKGVLPNRTTETPPALVFHGVQGENFQTADSPSWFNPQEACQVFLYLNELFYLGVPSDEIGVISPYSKQCKQIIELLSETDFDLPKIGTVEDFQGQEFSVILLSTVRSSDGFLEKDIKHQLGFVSNPRRLNVALTRAKSLLIIVGNPTILSKDNYWMSVINYCIENGSYCGCPF